MENVIIFSPTIRDDRELLHKMLDAVLSDADPKHDTVQHEHMYIDEGGCFHRCKFMLKVYVADQPEPGPSPRPRPVPAARIHKGTE